MRAVQRHFLRKIAGPRRAPNEEYVDWIRRATKIAVTKAKEAGIECWLTQFLHMKWKWAGKVCNMTEERLAKRATIWRDSEWWKDQPRGATAYGIRPMRARPGNILRWEDELRKFSESQGWDSWQQTALNDRTWTTHADSFVAWAWR